MWVQLDCEWVHICGCAVVISPQHFEPSKISAEALSSFQRSGRNEIFEEYKNWTGKIVNKEVYHDSDSLQDAKLRAKNTISIAWIVNFFMKNIYTIAN